MDVSNSTQDFTTLFSRKIYYKVVAIVFPMAVIYLGIMFTAPSVQLTMLYIVQIIVLIKSHLVT